MIVPAYGFEDKLIELGVLQYSNARDEGKMPVLVLCGNVRSDPSLPHTSTPFRALHGIPHSTKTGILEETPAFSAICNALKWQKESKISPTFWKKVSVFDSSKNKHIDKKESLCAEDIERIDCITTKSIVKYVNKYNSSLEHTTKVIGSNGRRFDSRNFKLSTKVLPSIGRMSAPWVVWDKGEKADLCMEYKGAIEPVAEIDLSAFYPTLFHAHTGIELHTSYGWLADKLAAHPTWDPRKTPQHTAKRVINAVLTASTHLKAIQAVQQQINFCTKIGDDQVRLRAETIITMLYNQYPGLREETEGVQWATTMNRHESLLMARIGLGMQSEGIPYLHCYDALYMPLSAKETAQRIMDEAYQQYTSEISA